MRFAAIDIGSNAIRLLLSNVINGDDKPVVFKKAELVRIPIRLGEDSFLKGEISEEKAEKLIKSLKAFKLLIDVYDAVSYRACATSAMRDAANGDELVSLIKEETGLNVEMIDGKTEADIIYSNRADELLDKSCSYLYIDIGGGSTEITLFSKNEIVASRSFNVGTIRMLHEQIDKAYWNEFKSWIRETTNGVKPLIAIGSGGNINKLFKMTRRKQNKPVSADQLKEIYEMLDSYTYEERIKELGLNPDRADVIIPASKILLSALKHAGINEMIVPQIGLADGIVHQLYEEYKAQNLVS